MTVGLLALNLVLLDVRQMLHSLRYPLDCLGHLAPYVRFFCASYRLLVPLAG